MLGNPLGYERSALPTWILFGLLVVAVALLGGSSRPDAIQLIPLRAAASFLLCLGLIWVTRDQLRRVAPLLWWLAGLAALMALQLLPLPPFLWQSLPGREGVVALEQAWALEGVWRPISLVPDRTLNALLSLIVPFAVVVLAAGTDAKPTSLLACIIFIAFFDAALGILQVLGADQLKFYAITTEGAPAGLFANENHSGVFSALALLIIALVATANEGPWQGTFARLALAVAVLTISIAALLSGSRAGLLMTLLAIAGGLWAGWARLSGGADAVRGKASSWAMGSGIRRGAFIALVLIVGMVLLSLIRGNRTPALTALLGEAGFESLRWSIAPVLLEMMMVFGGLGAGFGAFEEAYHIFEPDGLMQPRYINQAHNDWAQLIIEGGLLGLGLLIFAIGYLVRTLFALHASRRGSGACVGLWSALFFVIGMASLVDYPLRTPLGQLVGILCVLAFLAWGSTISQPRQSPVSAADCQPRRSLKRFGRIRRGHQTTKRWGGLVFWVGVFGLGVSGCAGNRDVGLADTISISQIGEMPVPQEVSLPGIAPLEELEIFVVGVADLSGTYVVDEDAQILFPHIGLVDLSGLSANEAAQKLGARLEGDFLRDPQVRVLRSEKAALTVSVGGQVNRPGAYEVTAAYSLLRAVNDAGGLGDIADIDDVLVLRTVAGQDFVGVYNLRAIARGNYADPELFAGDIVMVGENRTRRAILDAVRLVPFVSSFVVLINRL